MTRIDNLQQFVTVLIGTVSAYWISRLAGEENINWLLLVLILVAISILVWLLSHIINERVVKANNERLMELYEFERQLQGLWLERYEKSDIDGRLYCLIEIIYDEKSKSLHLKGSVYNDSGVSIANWSSKSVYLNRNTKSILYIYDGEFKEERLEGDGYGKLSFSTSSSKEPISGWGCFEDSYTMYKPINFHIDKLDKTLCEQIGNISVPHRSFEKEKFIRMYHKYLAEQLPTKKKAPQSASQLESCI